MQRYITSLKLESLKGQRTIISTLIKKEEERLKKIASEVEQKIEQLNKIGKNN